MVIALYLPANGFTQGTSASFVRSSNNGLILRVGSLVNYLIFDHLYKLLVHGDTFVWFRVHSVEMLLAKFKDAMQMNTNARRHTTSLRKLLITCNVVLPSEPNSHSLVRTTTLTLIFGLQVDSDQILLIKCWICHFGVKRLTQRNFEWRFLESCLAMIKMGMFSPQQLQRRSYKQFLLRRLNNILGTFKF